MFECSLPLFVRFQVVFKTKNKNLMSEENFEELYSVLVYPLSLVL